MRMPATVLVNHVRAGVGEKPIPFGNENKKSKGNVKSFNAAGAEVAQRRGGKQMPVQKQIQGFFAYGSE